MSDRDARILRPVALPPKFLGAPREPAAANVTTFAVVMILCFASRDYSLAGIGFMLAAVPVHFAIMWYGFKEPHMGTLIGTSRKNKKTARGAGRSAARYFPGA